MIDGDLLGQIRTAFDYDDVARKNLMLRKAYDEITRLRAERGGEQGGEGLTWARDQVVALCEDTETRYEDMAGDIEGKNGAFARGRIMEAKSIRNAICEAVRAKLAGRERGGEPAQTASETANTPIT